MGIYSDERKTTNPPVVGNSFAPAQNQMTASPPSQGGLNATNYNNPYQNQYADGGGLRAWKLPDGGYGGTMMPKGAGWMGSIPSLDGKRVMTEYSMGGENGEPHIPSIYENMPQDQIQNVRMMEAGKLGLRSPQAQAVFRDATAAAERRKAQGLGAFKDLN